MTRTDERPARLVHGLSNYLCSHCFVPKPRSAFQQPAWYGQEAETPKAATAKPKAIAKAKTLSGLFKMILDDLLCGLCEEIR